MIRYTLRCAHAHEFESWFRDSAAFDEQKTAGHVACPLCGSSDVSKALMAPAVRTRRAVEARAEPRGEPTPASDAASVPVAMADEHAAKLRAMMRAFRDHVIANSTNVGPAFAEEARKIHDGVAEERPIRGEASPDDVRSLLEDGIEIMPLPAFPDDRN